MHFLLFLLSLALLPRWCCDKWAVQTAPRDQKVPGQGLLLRGALPHHLLPLHGQLRQRAALWRGAPRSTQRHPDQSQQGTALSYDIRLVHLKDFGLLEKLTMVYYPLAPGLLLSSQSHNLSHIVILFTALYNLPLSGLKCLPQGHFDMPMIKPPTLPGPPALHA